LYEIEGSSHLTGEDDSQNVTEKKKKVKGAMVQRYESGTKGGKMQTHLLLPGARLGLPRGGFYGTPYATEEKEEQKPGEENPVATIIHRLKRERGISTWEEEPGVHHHQKQRNAEGKTTESWAHGKPSPATFLTPTKYLPLSCTKGKKRARRGESK